MFVPRKPPPLNTQKISPLVVYVPPVIAKSLTSPNPHTLHNASLNLHDGSFDIIIEGSLEVKLPTIWTVEKQR